MSVATGRAAQTDAPVLDVLAERWSPRVFSASAPLDEEALRSALEAARWAPSAVNSQPWRMIVARRGGAAHAALEETLSGFNRAWAGTASALVVMVAESVGEDGTPLPWAIYDTGQAAAHFTIQAQADGLATHQLAGFDRDAVRSAFALEERFAPLTMIAVGRAGSLEGVSEELRARELAPRTRRPISASLLRNA